MLNSLCRVLLAHGKGLNPVVSKDEDENEGAEDLWKGINRVCLLSVDGRKGKIYALLFG